MVGVLPIAVGKATRMVEFMQDEGKGSMKEKSLWDFLPQRRMPAGMSWSGPQWKCLLDAEEVDRMIAQMVGEIEQVPPHVLRG